MRTTLLTWTFIVVQLAAVVLVLINIHADGLVAVALALALTGALAGALSEAKALRPTAADEKAEDRSATPAR